MPRDTLYYDGACGLCQRSTRVLRALDWLGRLGFEDMNRVPEDELPVAWDDAMRGIPMRTGAGGTLVGYDAMRRALAQTPLGLPMGLAMYLPGVSHAGRRVYAWVARNRPRSACAAPRGA
jgi:predicted DCC family thiol-disulfide oxidoreductase YuxK